MIMIKGNAILEEDNIKETLTNVLSVLDIKITLPSLLKDIHKNTSLDKNVIEGICSILSGWGIDVRYLPLSYEMLEDLPVPSLIFLFENQIEKLYGQFFILLSQDDNGAELVDPEGNSRYMDISEIQAKWSSIVIALDAEDAVDEEDYEKKITLQREKVSEAGGVSVIMPVFNQATFIRRALVSLQRQTYGTWELILINDGSNDNLEDIIAPFLEDQRVHYLKNQDNEGIGYSLNQGLSHASYNMVTYLPADDIYYEDHLRTLVEALVTTGATMACSGVVHHVNDQFGVDYGQRASGP